MTIKITFDDNNKTPALDAIEAALRGAEHAPGFTVTRAFTAKGSQLAIWIALEKEGGS